MIRHFKFDGTVKQEWPEGLHASQFERDGKTFARVQGSNFVLAEVELHESEQIGEVFVKHPEPAAVAALEQSAPLIAEVAANPGVIEALRSQGIEPPLNAPAIAEIPSAPAIADIPSPSAIAD